ncbi:hypothetical protein N7517_009901 [Penicillium concentricum]|uniref:F-box domain-containing protein n=1 Tax=Penicillium concentricum TaxID=293559 RepID=A0A9W9RI96_9EURO|nr:uncharacterized protein N7517_009901 [Penicillium concentricum]KAJ5360710.1 hypothetical protein N7517_009901 [Penicillium concentricum]
MTAQDTALGTMEVLENILLHLDLKCILTSAQRVCHQWQDLISTSPSLQKHLFFQPDWDREDKQRNPLLAEIFPDWFPDFPTPAKRRKDHGIEIGPDDIKPSWKRMLIQQPPIRDIIFFMVKSARGGKWLGGPYTKTVEDSRTHWFSVTDPLTMDDFIYTVPDLGEDLDETMVLWDNEDHQIPSEFHDYSFNDKERRFLRGALEECGMILLEYAVMQCGKGLSVVGRRKRKFGTPFFEPQVEDAEEEEVEEIDDDEHEVDEHEEDEDREDTQDIHPQPHKRPRN